MTHEEKEAYQRELLEVWKRAVKPVTSADIMAGLQRALASQEWTCEEDIPYLAEWLKSRGWERQYTPAARA
jgi:hypothetical protein